MLILLISNCLNGKLLSEKTYKAYKEKKLDDFHQNTYIVIHLPADNENKYYKIQSNCFLIEERLWKPSYTYFSKDPVIKFYLMLDGSTYQYISIMPDIEYWEKHYNRFLYINRPKFTEVGSYTEPVFEAGCSYAIPFFAKETYCGIYIDKLYSSFPSYVAGTGKRWISGNSFEGTLQKNQSLHIYPYNFYKVKYEVKKTEQVFNECHSK